MKQKPPRSALPLPRYVDRKPEKRLVVLLNIPIALEEGWLPGQERTTLGNEYEAAVRLAETILLPALDGWRAGIDAVRHRHLRPRPT